MGNPIAMPIVWRESQSAKSTLEDECGWIFGDRVARELRVDDTLHLHNLFPKLGYL
jgi:hypothetical protein